MFVAVVIVVCFDLCRKLCAAEPQTWLWRQCWPDPAYVSWLHSFSAGRINIGLLQENKAGTIQRWRKGKELGEVFGHCTNRRAFWSITAMIRYFLLRFPLQSRCRVTFITRKITRISIDLRTQKGHRRDVVQPRSRMSAKPVSSAVRRCRKQKVNRERRTGKERKCDEEKKKEEREDDKKKRTPRWRRRRRIK